MRACISVELDTRRFFLRVNNMTNEQLVEQIKKGYCVNKNMEQLYNQNLPLIKKVCKPFSAYEPLEDLLQESFLSLYKAVEMYDLESDIAFITYAKYWVKCYLHKYMDKCKDLCVPRYMLEMQQKYKRAMNALQNRLYRQPTTEEIAEEMKISISKVEAIRITLLGSVSINEPLQEDEELTLADTIKGDLNVEESIVDKICKEQQKSELWGFVEQYTSNVENDILREYFIKNKSMAAIARDYNMSFHNVRTIKQNGLRKLKTGKAKRNLQKRFEVLEPKLYRSSVKRFKHDMESTVDRIACKRLELEGL